MKNNKTLFVSYQYKRKGFFYFLCVTFLLHLAYYGYDTYLSTSAVMMIENLPEEFITINKTIESEVSPRALKQPKQLSKVLTSKAIKTVLDVNHANASDFQRVYGIGPVYSERIVKFRNSLGAFVHMDQLYQVYGLDSVVVKAIKASFSVQDTPVTHKISVNSASEYELQRLPFFTKELAGKIVRERARNGLFNDFHEISNILSLPEDKIEIIKLYLIL
ncbi:MAG: helix-hairpin-helix domain-containing protein [Flavobacteriaceae bacterium]|nr:helix-hairpin-helix domain-containing protein [Flavobacteriaceae bacterium]MDG2415014.1 helix-hairpin-helix domain-containing protein [Flavobacteriaceae bacterium]